MDIKALSDYMEGVTPRKPKETAMSNEVIVLIILAVGIAGSLMDYCGR